MSLDVFAFFYVSQLSITDSFNAVMEGSVTNPTNQMVREIRRD